MSSQRKILIAIASAVAALVLIGGTALIMFLGDGDEPPIADDTTTSTTATTQPTTTTTVAQTDDRNGYTGNGEDNWDDIPTRPLPPMGMPSLDIDWEIVTLPIPVMEGDGYVLSISELDGRLYVTSNSWHPEADQPVFSVFESVDGMSWTELSVEALAGHNIDLVIPYEGGLIATGHNWYREPDTYRQTGLVMFQSSNGRDWREINLSGFEVPQTMLWMHMGAGTDDALLIAGSRDPDWSVVDGDPVIIRIRRDGKVLELNDATYGYLLLDEATGKVLLQGSQDRMFNWEGEDYGYGTIFDSQTGEAIISVDMDEFREAAESAYEQAKPGDRLVVELGVGDRLVRLDEFTDKLEVMAEDGSVLFTGHAYDMWRGRPPTIVDPATGDVLLVIPWEVWEKAHEDAYADRYPQDYWEMPQAVMLRSTDGGRSFTEATTALPEGMVSGLVYGPDGFLMVMTTYTGGEVMYEEGSDVQALYRSDDGLAWERVEGTNVSSFDWLDLRTASDSSYLAIAHEFEENVVIRSASGARWEPLLEIADLELPIGSAWFNQVTASDHGVFVTGNRHAWEPESYEFGSMTKYGRTFQEVEVGYRLIDVATSAVLFEHEWTEYEEHYDERGPGLYWGEGGVVIFAEDGTIMFAASHSELERDFYQPYDPPEFVYEDEPILLYLPDGSTGWVQVTLPDELGQHTWISHLFVKDDLVFVGVSLEHEPDDAHEYWYTTPALLVGRVS